MKISKKQFEEYKAEALEHYDKMIGFSLVQDPDEFPDAGKMLKKIKQDWYGDHCVYCKNIKCKECPLNVEVRGIKKYCCSKLWISMSASTKWEHFTDRAQIIREFIDKIIYEEYMERVQ